jgi:hypothetical protein
MADGPISSPDMEQKDVPTSNWQEKQVSPNMARKNTFFSRLGFGKVGRVLATAAAAFGIHEAAPQVTPLNEALKNTPQAASDTFERVISGSQRSLNKALNFSDQERMAGAVSQNAKYHKQEVEGTVPAPKKTVIENTQVKVDSSDASKAAKDPVVPNGPISKS